MKKIFSVIYLLFLTACGKEIGAYDNDMDDANSKKNYKENNKKKYDNNENRLEPNRHYNDNDQTYENRGKDI